MNNYYLPNSNSKTPFTNTTHTNCAVCHTSPTYTVREVESDVTNLAGCWQWSVSPRVTSGPHTHLLPTPDWACADVVGQSHTLRAL